MLLWLWILMGCQPPPLSNLSSGEPGISFIFPDSNADIIICPSFIVSVDVENWTLAPEQLGEELEEEGIGHWHLRDAAGEYIVATGLPWVEVSLGSDEDFAEPVFTGISAHLASHNHNELNTALYPGSVATAEFTVGATDDCVGGGSGGVGSDTGSY